MNADGQSDSIELPPVVLYPLPAQGVKRRSIRRSCKESAGLVQMPAPVSDGSQLSKDN